MNSCIRAISAQKMSGLSGLSGCFSAMPDGLKVSPKLALRGFVRFVRQIFNSYTYARVRAIGHNNSRAF